MDIRTLEQFKAENQHLHAADGRVSVVVDRDYGLWACYQVECVASDDVGQYPRNNHDGSCSRFAAFL